MKDVQFKDSNASFSGLTISVEVNAFSQILKYVLSVQGAERIGYPVVIKASEGGGGKGIRKVENSDDFPSFFRQVCVLIVCQNKNLFLFQMNSLYSTPVFFSPSIGSDRGSGIPHFHHEAGSACKAPGGADTSR